MVPWSPCSARADGRCDGEVGGQDALCCIQIPLPDCLEETTSRTYKKRAAKEDKKED